MSTSLTTNQVIQRLTTQSTPWALMLIGLPGSGKTTLVNAMQAAGLSFATLGTDKLIEAAARDSGQTYGDIFRQVSFKIWRTKMELETLDAFALKQSVVIDQTNMSPKSRRHKIDRFVGSYACIALCFDVPDVELQRRLQTRGALTGKVIPPHVIDDMTKSYIPPAKAEGWSAIWQLAQ